MSKKVIRYLESEAARLFEGEEFDEAASEYYAHLRDVISDLEAGRITVKQASESLSINLQEAT